ncbi:hypothetical protein NM688_g6006 [Phlebia brevispora]|uniref:Uncharacterized protein n=1 Tax=Phlebia brevispora TaxID=194682 RepID=A0ACC1SLK3_9APHY|nr:hypothetical protein NM688_g6006 [Phlebia brevispora]
MSMSSTSPPPPPLLSEDHTNSLPMAWRLPEVLKSCSPTELALQWIRVPPRELAEIPVMYPPSQPATAADLPAELCYTVLKFLSLGTCYKTRVPDVELHKCKDEAECTRHYVGCDWEELCRIALVCRRWYRLLKDELDMSIILYNREDLKVILANLNFVHHYTSARSIFGEPDLIEHLRTPWIHQISLRVLTTLKIPTRSVELMMKNSEPFPRGQIVSSIHNSLPRRLPRFSSGIEDLCLSGVHFKRFEHLVWLIKEMPSVSRVYLAHVTWDPQTLGADQIARSTSFLERENRMYDVSYLSDSCTDDKAAAWLAIFVGLTREDVLDQNDARSLWAIVMAFREDQMNYYEQTVDEIKLRRFTVFHTPRAGARQKRKVRAVAFHLSDRHWSGVTVDWGEIDRRLASCGALEVVLLAFFSWDSLCKHHNSIRTSFLASLNAVHMYSSSSHLKTTCAGVKRL